MAVRFDQAPSAMLERKESFCWAFTLTACQAFSAKGCDIRHLYCHFL
jgi:hypothetical protein